MKKSEGRIKVRISALKTLEAGDINDYERKAIVSVDNLEHNDGIYVHIKGPDEFGHDGDAQGKKRSIEEIESVLRDVTKRIKKREADNSNFF